MKNETAACPRELAGLRGPVRRSVEETIWHANPHSPERRLTITTEYDPHGRELHRHNKEFDGSEQVTTNDYDSAGRLLKFEHRSAEAFSAQVYTYNAQGQLIREVRSSSSNAPGDKTLEYAYDSDGRLLSIVNDLCPEDRSLYRYDDSGRLSITQSFDRELLRAQRQSAFSGSPVWAARSGHGVPEGGSVTTLHDANENPVEVQIRDAEGNLVTRITCIYDDQEHLIEEKTVIERIDSLFPPEIMAQLTEQGLSREEIRDQMQQSVGRLLQAQHGEGVFNTTHFTYDAEGRLLETHRRIGPFHEFVRATRYNQHGDKSEEFETTHGAPDAQLDEAGNPIPATIPVPPPMHHELRYTYQYDERGNWIEQVMTSRPNSTDAFQPSRTRRRDITYD